MVEGDLYCDTCDRTVEGEAATRTEPYGNLDSNRWQPLCCPDCGFRLKTVFVGAER